MSSLRLRTLVRRTRARIAVLVAVVALAGAVVAHHGVPTMDMHGMPAQAMLCLAVLGGALMVAAGVALVARVPVLRAARVVAPRVLCLPASPLGLPARASPVRLQVLRL
jgi:hypothetical protein